ncbi:MAG TPA: hypothetical protein VN112_03425 [Ensifer sp.]|nr:hypothetical protein [Ensifer sp.]
MMSTPANDVFKETMTPEMVALSDRRKAELLKELIQQNSLTKEPPRP